MRNPTLPLLCLRSISLAPPQITGAEKPNILFIFSDDHAEHAISAYGSKVNQTPHLDRLAAGGTRFTNSFVTNYLHAQSRDTFDRSIFTPQRCTGIQSV